MNNTLKTEYVKEWMDTILYVDHEVSADDLYKENMLSNNESPHIVTPQSKMRDGKTMTCFNVTGRKSLELMFRTHSIREWQLVIILECLMKAFENGKELLLDDSDFVLNPELIFMDITDYKTEFLYLPGYNMEIKKQLEGLFEFMLNRVNYDDKAAVELLYDCYVIAMKEEKGLEVLKERVMRKEPETPLENNNIINDIKITNSPKPLFEEEQKEDSLFGWFKKKKKKKSIKAEDLEDELVADESLLSEDNKTICLSVQREEKKPTLTAKYDGYTYIIEKTPFYIGSLVGHTDCTLRDNTVSRLHAEISVKDNKYYIADLNSTNGTFVNEEEVLPGRNHELVTKDILRVANLSFVFDAGGKETAGER